MTGEDRIDAAYALWEQGFLHDAEASYATIRDSLNENQEERQYAERSVCLIREGKEPEIVPQVLPAPFPPPPRPL